MHRRRRTVRDVGMRSQASVNVGSSDGSELRAHLASFDTDVACAWRSAVSDTCGDERVSVCDVNVGLRACLGRDRCMAELVASGFDGSQCAGLGVGWLPARRVALRAATRTSARRSRRA